jgi:signal transduction histidine kinase
LNNNKTSDTIRFQERRWQYQMTPFTNEVKIVENGGESTFLLDSDATYQMTFLDVTQSYKTLQQLLITFIMVGTSMLLVIFFISLYFANRSIKPISFTWEKQKQFVADASHELKTPLAIIHANSDALLANEKDTIKNQKKWLDYIKIETQRMTKLINDLLYLAKTEDTSVQTIYATFDISNVVNSAVLSMEAIIFEKGLNLTYEVTPELLVKGDPEQIKQVILILLDNAIKYTKEQGHIDIYLKKTKRSIEFTIKNTGEGINRKNISRIFDRFYRTDPSRATETGGYGLGLSVAKAIVDRHNGRILGTSVEGESTTFTFILPLN